MEFINILGKSVGPPPINGDGSNSSDPSGQSEPSKPSEPSPVLFEPNFNQKNIGINTDTNLDINNINQLDFTRPALYTKVSPDYVSASYYIHFTTGDKPSSYKNFNFRVFPVAIFWKNIGNSLVVGNRKISLNQSKGFSTETKVSLDAKGSINVAIGDAQKKFPIKREFKTGTDTSFNMDQKFEFSIDVTDKNVFFYQKYILYAHQSSSHVKEGGIKHDDDAVRKMNHGIIYSVAYSDVRYAYYMFSAVAAEDIYASYTDAPFQEFTEGEIINQLLGKDSYRINKLDEKY